VFTVTSFAGSLGVNKQSVFLVIVNRAAKNVPASEGKYFSEIRDNLPGSNLERYVRKLSRGLIVRSLFANVRGRPAVT
jgi:hypothetical protein